MERQRPRKKLTPPPRPRTKKPARDAHPPVQDELVRVARRGLGPRPAHRRPAVVELMSRRALLVAARQLLRRHIDRCTKCGSTYVSHEPAFVHCHYCGRLHRVANASLQAQELFELRSGMRLAS